MLTAFSAGELVPPRWLHNAGHTPDWIERHKTIAADDSAFCGNCHSSDECTDCHDGKVRPRSVHPNDWLSMHAEAARQDNPRCVSCHQQQTFCADCHRRVGVARDVASGNRASGRRFHPSPSVWTTGPRSPEHHYAFMHPWDDWRPGGTPEAPLLGPLHPDLAPHLHRLLFLSGLDNFSEPGEHQRADLSGLTARAVRSSSVGIPESRWWRRWWYRIASIVDMIGQPAKASKSRARPPRWGGMWQSS